MISASFQKCAESWKRPKTRCRTAQGRLVRYMKRVPNPQELLIRRLLRSQPVLVNLDNRRKGFLKEFPNLLLIGSLERLGPLVARC